MSLYETKEPELSKDLVVETQTVSKEAPTTAETSTQGPSGDSLHPDGGVQAWLVVLGVASGTCGTFGMVNAWGVFQAYYEQTLLQNSSPSDIAWIGSIQYALNFLPGLAVGRLFDTGWFYLPLCSASALLVAATFLTGECTQFWHFLLCQGFAVGIACGVVFNAILCTPAHWFKRRLGLALGLCSIGSSVGGTIFPIIIRLLIRKIGFSWTMRTVGFIELALLTTSILTTRRRLPPKQQKGRQFIDFHAFSSLPFVLYCIAGFLSFLGLYTVLTYIGVSAAAAGISPDFAFYLVAIANGCSAIGRLAGGIIADTTGPLSVMAPATFVSGVMTYAWPFATSIGSNVAVAVIYGMANGVFVSLLPAPLMQIEHPQSVGVLIGMNMSVLALGAVAGPPISGAINAATHGFKYVGVYAGSMIMLAVMLLLATRFAILGRFRGKC